MNNKTYRCPYCKEVLSKNEFKYLHCKKCKHYLIWEGNTLRLPKFKHE